MHPFGLHVSIIEPGWLRTPIIQGHDRSIRKLWNELSSEVRNRWGDEFCNDLIEKLVIKSPFINNAEDPMKVVRGLQHAVMNTKPHIRYHPDLQGKFVFYSVVMLSCLVD